MNLAIPIRNQKGRAILRTFADVTAALRQAGVSSDARITIRTGKFPLPNGADVLIRLSVNAAAKSEQTVLLPATTMFHAATSNGRQSFPAMRLDHARLLPDGSVRLQDGAILHAIDLNPPRLSPHLSKKDMEIVLSTIDVLNLHRFCYREISPGVLPDKVLDFALFPMVRLPPLNVIEQRLWKSGIKATRQKIAGALFAAGMRVPRSKKSKTVATFSPQ